MKRLLTVAIMLTLAITVYAFSPRSMLSDASFGLFSNEMDDAGSVGSAFLDLEDDFIFGGLANFNEVDTSSVNGNLPIMAGVHKEGETPWSAFLSLEVTDPSGLMDNTSLDTFNYGTSDSDGKPIPWISRNITTKYAGKIADDFEADITYIQELDGNVIGPRLIIDRDCSNFNPASNYTQTTSYYFDDSSNPGTSEPDQTLDYTKTEKRVARNTDTSIIARVPFYDAQSGRTLTGWVSFDMVNDTSKHSLLYSDTEDTNHTQTDIIRDDVIDRGTTLILGGSFGDSADSPFGDTFSYSLGGSLGVGFNTYAEYDETLTRVYTAGNSGTDSTYDNDTIEYSFAPDLSVNVGASASQSFSYDLGGGLEFSMRPSVNAWFASANSNGAKLKKIIEVETTDLNNDGKIEEGTDLIRTTTVEYKNTNGSGGNTARSTDLFLDASYATALRFQPKKWIVGLSLGSELGLTQRLSYVSSKTGTQERTIVTNNAGTETTAYISNNTGNAGARDITTDWTTSVDTDICFNVDLAENFTVYIDLNNVSFTDLDDVTVQAIVSM